MDKTLLEQQLSELPASWNPMGETDANQRAILALTSQRLYRKTADGSFAAEMAALYAEMEARETVEAKIYKALDGLEALIQHNESDISTWIAHEYELNLVYGNDKVAFSAYLTALREEIRQETLCKIETESKDAAVE